MYKVWFRRKINALATHVNVRAWISVYRSKFYINGEKLKVLDICAGSGGFVEGLVCENLIHEGVSMDQNFPTSPLNHNFIVCDITQPIKEDVSFKPDLISINNSIQLFSDPTVFCRYVKYYKPRYIFITKPTELVIDCLIERGCNLN